jgi:hypothetical protein
LKSNAGLRSNVWGSRFFSGDKDGQKRRKCLGQAAFFSWWFLYPKCRPLSASRFGISQMEWRRRDGNMARVREYWAPRRPWILNISATLW